VIAITAILMFIMFIPLTKSLEIQSRGQARITGQDNVRSAMRRVTKDLANALQVYEPRPLSLWGYSAWNLAAKPPQPTAAAVPERYIVPNGVLAMRLPKMAYFCRVSTINPNTPDHPISPVDMNLAAGTPYDYVAIDSCPRHTGAPIEVKPVTPLQPDDRIVAYFIGLKNPGFRRGAAGAPHGEYDNLLLFRTGRPTLNTYVLYRAEFDPRDPRFANWNDPTTGQPNPDFFYETATVAGAPTWQWWKAASVEVMNAETADCSRWVETAGKWVPHPTISFGAGHVAEEVAQPNRAVGTLASGLGGGTKVAGELPAVEYQADHGNWISKRTNGDDPNRVIDDSELVSVPGDVNANEPGAEVTVLEDRGAAGYVPIFRSSRPNTATTPRNRLVSYDPLTGKVRFGFTRQDYTPPSGMAALRLYYSAPIDADTFTTSLAQTTTPVSFPGDVESDPSGLPSSFGAALNDPRFAATAMIVFGSESISLVDTTTGQADAMRRVGWTGLGQTLDRFVSQGDLEEDEYTIDYRTGAIELSDRNPARWLNSSGTPIVGPGQSLQLWIRYQFQTNRPTDVVKVSYLTKELISIKIGVVQYTRKNAEAVPFEVTQRVAVRNVRR